MPLYKNRQPSSLSINNSFSAKPSGDKFVFNNGNLFSDSGFDDKSFFVFRSGEERQKEDFYLSVEVSPKNIYSTGVNFVSEEESREKDLDENLFSFRIPLIKDTIPKNFSSDIFLFKNSGERPILNCYLSKGLDDSFVLKIFSGSVEDIPISTNLCKAIDLGKRNGQKIFYVTNNSNSTSIEIEEAEELSYNDQTSFSKTDNGLGWNFSEIFSTKTPLCIVDFDRESVSSFYSSNINISQISPYGINGNGYVSIY